jgi:hypothetical protein
MLYAQSLETIVSALHVMENPPCCRESLIYRNLGDPDRRSSMRSIALASNSISL